MKILVIGNRIPWPLHDGGAIATYQLLEDLSKAGHEVVYFSYNTQKHFVTEKEIEQHLSFCEVIAQPLDATLRVSSAIKNLFSQNSYFLERYYDTKTSILLAELLNQRNFDLVQVEGLYSYPLLQKSIHFWGESFAIDIRELHSKGIPVIYRAHNVEHEIWERLAQNEPNVIKRIYLKLQTRRLKREELNCIKSVSGIVAISTNDTAFFEKYSQAKVHTHFPSVKTSLKRDIHIQPDRLFHIGSMEWDANVQAIQWFLSKVWPLVKAEVPEVTLHVAGKGIGKWEHLFFQTGVINHGEVRDSSKFMETHGIGLVPLLAGSGIRMKLIQALSLGIPCVATSIAVQGLPLKKDESIISVADNAVDFAQKVVDLLKNRKKAIALAKAGHAYCLEYHNPTQNQKLLDDFYKEIIISSGKTS